MLERLPEVEGTLNTMKTKRRSLTRKTAMGQSAASMYLYLPTFPALLLHFLFSGWS